MAKKDYKTGMAGLLTPTTEKTKTSEIPEIEGLYVSIPCSLKRRMDMYCAEHKIKKHTFVTDAIRKMLDY
jgi:hypothetical protein